MKWVIIIALFYGISVIMLLWELRRTPGYGIPITNEGRVYEVFQAGLTTKNYSEDSPQSSPLPIKISTYQETLPSTQGKKLSLLHHTSSHEFKKRRHQHIFLTHKGPMENFKKDV